jgi:hypothetical protein
MVLVAVLCFLILFSALWKLWKRGEGGIAMSGDRVDGEMMGSSMPPVDGRDPCLSGDQPTVDIPL